jgi:hypothetical protein
MTLVIHDTSFPKNLQSKLPVKIIQFPKTECRKNVLIEINLTIDQSAEI